jgi:hypothetical protein
LGKVKNSNFHLKTKRGEEKMVGEIKKQLLKRRVSKSGDEIWKIELILKREKRKTKNGEIIIAHRKARGKCLGKRWSVKANYFKVVRFIIKKGGRRLTVGESEKIRKAILSFLQDKILAPQPEEIRLLIKPKKIKNKSGGKP